MPCRWLKPGMRQAERLLKICLLRQNPASSHILLVLFCVYHPVNRSCLRFTAFICLLVITGHAHAQLIDNSSTFRNTGSERYFRFHYDNDYFTKSDEYYTQGITFELVHPAIKKFPLTRLLWKPFAGEPVYGASLNLFGHTPTSILSDSILYGDRPFNADITLKTFLVQADEPNHQQIASAFTAGVMGPAALGYEIQYNIHRWLKNPLPHGWQYQTRNDIIINYQLDYEKQLLAAGNYFLLNTTAALRLGTLDTRLSAGFNLMAGRFNRRFSKAGTKKRKAEYYFYTQSRAHLVGYDAGMQGGLFNQSSPYVISAADINRITYQADAGIIVNFRKLFLSYTQSILSKEFRTGKYHRWGGISIGFAW